MLELLSKGILLGLAAGIAPGPLLVLVVAETLRHNTLAGIKVAVAPMVTDLPIIFLALMILPKLPHLQAALGIVSIMGAVFIFYLACDSLRSRGLQLDIETVSSRSFRKGVVTNWLNPHPYVFWVGVGVPVIYRAGQAGWENAAVFVGSFFVCIVGSKIVLAILVSRSKTFLSGPVYVYVVKGLGLLLGIFGVMLARDGLRFLGVGL